MLKTDSRTRFLRWVLGLAALMCCAPFAPAWGQEATNTAEKTYDLKFASAPLDQVLKFYCDITGRTALESPGAKATINLRSQTRLTREETMQALKAVLAMNGIAFVEIGERFVKVVPIQSAQQEGLALKPPIEGTNRPDADIIINELIPLKHLDPADAQKAITGLLHSYGKIQVLERINSLLISDTMLNINRMHEILDQIDQPLELKEELHIVPILHAKASEIKGKLQEIITETKGQEKAPAPTVARPAQSGPPGVIRARVATPAAATPTAQAAVEEAETGAGKMIRGDVRMVADDRTGILIIITRPENMQYFENIIKALDIPTEPDVMVKMFRLEYAEAESVASMLNTLIGAAAPKSAPKTVPGTATTEAAKEGRSAALEDYIRQQREAFQAAQVAQAAQQVGGEGKAKLGELSADNIKILSDKRLNALIIMASKRDMATLQDLILGMDKMLSQVLIEAVILEITLTKDLQTGVDWVQRSMIAYHKNSDGSRRALYSFAGSGGGGKNSPADASSFTSSSSFSKPSGLTYYLTAYGLNVDAVIQMVSTDNRAQIISSPIIMTTDNKEAKINVAEDLYFYKGTTYNVVAGVQVPAVDVDLKKVGLTLTVTPHINTNKVVMMEITQKSESVVGSQDIPSSGSWPLTQISEMSASISVHSGETIVLGGLSKKEKSANKTKIPILGDIPLIRRLFGSVSDTSKRKERLVFITPYVLDTPEEIEASARRTQASLDDEGHWTRGWSASKLGDEPKDPIKEKAKKNTLFKLFKRKSSVSKSETDITKAAQAAASNAVPRPPETAAATNQPPAK